MAYLLPLRNNSANAIQFIEHDIRGLGEKIHLLTQRIAKHSANIFWYEKEWQKSNQRMNQEIKNVAQRKDEWRKYYDSIKYNRRVISRQDLNEELLNCDINIRSLSRSIFDLKDKIYRGNDEYHRRIDFEKDRIRSLSAERDRANNEKLRLEARVERIKKEALESPYKLSSRVDGRRIELCCRRNPNASVVPTPGKKHILTPNRFNQTGRPNAKHPDYIHFPSPGVSVRELDLKKVDHNTAQTDLRARAGLSLLEARVKEDARFAGDTQKSSYRSRRGHFNYTEDEFSRVAGRIKSMSSHPDSGTKRVGYTLKQSAQRLYEQHKENCEINGFVPKRLDLSLSEDRGH